MNGVGLGRQQRAHGERALGHPGAFVQQPRGLVERLDVDLDDRRSRAAPAARAPRRRRPPQARSPKNIRWPGARHADLRRAASRRAHPADAGANRDRLGVRSGDGGQRASRRRRRSARRSRRSRACGRPAPRRGRDQAEARLQADDVVEPGRHAARAGGVGAERERHQAGGDRDRRAGARAARE